MSDRATQVIVAARHIIDLLDATLREPDIDVHARAVLQQAVVEALTAMHSAENGLLAGPAARRDFETAEVHPGYIPVLHEIQEQVERHPEAATRAEIARRFTSVMARLAGDPTTPP